MTSRNRHAQRGAALVISLIMLTLITLLVITALNLGTSNFRAVSNTQFRDEAIAAANVAIQQVIGSDFTDDPAAQDLEVDLDNDGAPDYVVTIAEPTCIAASIASDAEESSHFLPGAMTVASTWNTVWDLDATVAPESNAGEAAVRVRSGVRVLLTQTEKNLSCPD